MCYPHLTFGSAILGGVSIAQSQGSPTRTIGILLNFAPEDPEANSRLETIKDRLRSLGWEEGRNLRLEVRWGYGRSEKIGSVAKELVSLQPDAILAHTTAATAALLRETKSIPIVFVNVSDPLGNKFIAAFKSPGGNATGFTNLEFSLGGKWVGLLKETAHEVRSIALLYNPVVTPFGPEIAQHSADVAKTLGVHTYEAAVKSEDDIRLAFEELSREEKPGLVVFPDSFLTPRREIVVSLAAKHRIPSVYPFKYWVQSGGLISYGSESTELYKNAATYIGRIFSGERPENLPVVSPTVYELAVNLRTAKELGLSTPVTALSRSNEVIE